MLVGGNGGHGMSGMPRIIMACIVVASANDMHGRRGPAAGQRRTALTMGSRTTFKKKVVKTKRMIRRMTLAHDA